MNDELHSLVRMARKEVKDLLDSLPSELSKRAAELPVTYEYEPTSDQIEDGIEPDTMGLFVGSAFPDDTASSADPLPAQIILFLKNIWDEAEGDEVVFRDEVRTTLMHELGHYLGLDESDLFDRGLD